MDRSDQQNLKEVLVKWYGQQANSWDVNDAVANVVVKMVNEISSCTAAMHFVPMPTTFGNPLGQLTKNYMKKFITALKDHSGAYLTCARTTILAYRTEVQMASMGL